MIKKCFVTVLLLCLLATAVFSQVEDGEVRQGLVNIALGKPVQASSLYAAEYPATNTVDGSTTTVWGSGMTNASEWIYVDLGEVTEINGLGLFWYQSYYAGSYSIYTSDDAANWILKATLTKSTPGNDVFTDNISFTARYIGIYFQNKKNGAIGLTEFEVYRKTAPTPTMTPTPTATPTTTPNPNLPDISFNQPWTIPAEGTLSNGVLTLTGDPSQYIKAQITIVKPADGDLYFMADIRFSGLVLGNASYKRPKFKVYDGAGTKIALQNYGTDIEDMWMSNGVYIPKNSMTATTTLILEFGLQNCEGTFEIKNPHLLDEKPAPSYDFPFEIPADTSCTLSVNTNEVMPFNNKILSVNSHFSWTSIGYESDMVKDIYRMLKLPDVRFPGGTVGNYYDWETDTFYPELIAHKPSLVKAYENGFHFGFNHYAALMKELASSGTLMFNVIADSVEKSKNRLLNRIASGIEILWVEMGNENYFSDQQGGNVTDAQSYITHTKNLTAGLKEVDPNVKTAINIGKDFFSPGDWNDTLSKETYYDGVIMHPYVRSNSFYLNHLSAHRMLSAYAIVNDYLGKYKAMFGNKPLLATEWGILPDGAGNNFVQALGVADAYFALMDGAAEGYIKQAGIHMLLRKELAHDTALFIHDEAANVIRKTRLGVIYEKYAELYKDSRLYTARSTATEIAPGLPAINARAIKTAQGESVIVAVNKLPVEAPLNLTINGTAYNGAYELSYFSENPLGDGKLYGFTEKPWQTTTGTGLIVLPAYSVCYITLK